MSGSTECWEAGPLVCCPLTEVATEALEVRELAQGLGVSSGGCPWDLKPSRSFQGNTICKPRVLKSPWGWAPESHGGTLHWGEPRASPLTAPGRPSIQGLTEDQKKAGIPRIRRCFG